MSNSRLGPFVLEERLGGERSSVYRALQVAQKRQAALRIFPSSMISTAAGRAAFTAEAALLKKLNHSNVARCYGGGLEGGQAYIAYDLIHGSTLAEVLKRRGRIAWEEVLKWGEQIASAMALAHDLGLLHLDLTPEKLIVADDGRIMVTDFRQDRPHNPLCVSSLVRTPQRLSFQSPEQIAQGHLDGKSDLFSLGCVLFTMLVGHPPCGAGPFSNLQAIADAQTNLPAPRVSSIVLDCPVWLDALIDQLLQKDPKARPHSAGAVKLALEEIQRKVVSGVGVMQHAMGGFSALKMQTDKKEAGRILGVRKKNEPQIPFYERQWFIIASLSFLCVVILFALSIPLWPKDEAKQMAKADKLMATGEIQNWTRARNDYLEPLLKSKDPALRERASEYIDKIEMQLAENRTTQFLERSWPLPTSEVAKQYAEASKLLRFGDEPEAFKRFEAITKLASQTGDDRPYFLLAQSKLAGVTIAAESLSKQEFIAGKIAEADKLRAEQKIAEAKKMLEGIVSLYGKEADLKAQVKAAQERLDSLAGGKKEKATTTEAEPE